ncbi:hypothetical protein F0562_003887 [Nyssa sinensis]|uniref:Uncharacterized protein n=1 Tax=Nyssa sinensis TaxID=561372 RepID=A0A5J5BW52_9ASTE|nr:hypothetical protein F0562_003887 [Nyssa sinensis]
MNKSGGNVEGYVPVFSPYFSFPESQLQEEMEKKEGHLVFVHRPSHGAWHWCNVAKPLRLAISRLQGYVSGPDCPWSLLKATG